MKLLFVSKLGPANLYIVNRVRERWQDAVVIRPYWVAPSRDASVWRRLRSAPVPTVAAAVRRASYAPYFRHVDRVVSEELFGSPRPPAPPESQAVPASSLNTAEGMERVRSVGPDLLILSGAPIIGDDLLRLPRLGTINVHFGISPQYRGSHTLFQALYREDYERVGVTLHFVDRGVDTGSIVAQGFPQLASRDTEATLQAKCARLAADLLIEFLAACPASSARGEPQCERGHLYRFRDRTTGQDVRHLLRRTLLGRRPTPREAHVVKHF